MATALYRRYRPETFAELIGQEHVTEPLRAALRAGRANHAYLFSGPRGCGKTTSARILARCLNCVAGPTDTPCGVCGSCLELARGGPGSLDVVEIDAASHGGVDDARELRERAAFAPARDRYKVYIIDEAHMVSPQGFNALLKIVEEPPEHVMFVFATTEPDKVLGTIRSRTHHYPFHLVPPPVLTAYLQHVCDAEGVTVGKGVLPLVVRAGAGSVRDSLSVLDQLAAGAGSDGIDYERAIGLLGYTHAALLDDIVSAVAAGDGATVFRVVDRVISSGQDPRRFVDDLLERLRDLVIVQAVSDRSAEVFPSVPADQLERMAVQAAAFGPAQLSRAADLTNVAATEMTGATSPRLHLELLCARLLLPAADASERGVAARLDRLERRLAVPVAGPVAGVSAQTVPAVPAPADSAPPVPPPPGPGAPGPVAAGSTPAATSSVAASGPEAPTDETAETTEAVRRMWPEILDHLATTKRRTWTRVSADAQVRSVDERQVVLQFRKAGTMAAFLAGPHAEAVSQSLVAVLGLDRQVVAVADDAPAPSRAPGKGAPGTGVAPATVPPTPPSTVSPEAPGGASSPALPPQVPARPASSTSGRSATGAPVAASAVPASAVPASGAPQTSSPQSSPTPPPSRTRDARTAAGPEFPPEPVDDEDFPPEFIPGDGPADTSSAYPATAGRPPVGPSWETPSASVPAAVQAPAAPPAVQAPHAPAPPTSAARPSVAPPTVAPPITGADLARSAFRAGASLRPRPDPSASPPSSSDPSSSWIDDEPSRDDADAEGSSLVGVAVAEQLLGGRIIGVEEHR